MEKISTGTYTIFSMMEKSGRYVLRALSVKSPSISPVLSVQSVLRDPPAVRTRLGRRQTAQGPQNGGQSLGKPSEGIAKH